MTHFLKKTALVLGIAALSLTSVAAMAYPWGPVYNPYIPGHYDQIGAWIPGHFRGGPQHILVPGCEWIPGHNSPNGVWVGGRYAGPGCCPNAGVSCD